MAVNLAQAGLSALTCEPDYCTAGAALTAGTLYLSQIEFEPRGALLPASIFAAVSTAGGGAGTGSFMGIYNCFQLNTPEFGALSPVAAGTRLAQTADVGNTLTAGWAAQALTYLPGIGELPPGFYWLAIVTNEATTQPTVSQGTGAGAVSIPNLGLGATAMRYATNGTGLTSLPATITVASNVATNARPLCLGLSL